MMRQDYFIWLFVAGVIIIPVCVFGIVKWQQNSFEDLPVFGNTGHKVGDFTLNDQHGNTITEKNWDNRIVVANFFFTHCPVVCPKMMKQLKKVQSLSSQDIIISSFTVDPQRDGIQTLKNYADKLNIANNWQLLTGEKKDIYLMARKDLLVIATDGDGGPDDFIHSDNLVLIDPQKRIRGFYKGTDEKAVNQLIDDIRKLNKEGK